MPRASGGGQLPIGQSLHARAALIDTGALLAIANSGDRHHADALECARAIARLRLPLFISLPTIYESHRRFLYDLGRPSADRLLREVFNASLNVVRTVGEDEAEARRLIARYAAIDLTLTDAVNMAVMLRFGIAVVFSFDDDYLRTGFIRIPPFHL